MTKARGAFFSPSGVGMILREPSLRNSVMVREIVDWVDSLMKLTVMGETESASRVINCCLLV